MMPKSVAPYFFAALNLITQNIGAQNKPAATVRSIVSFSVLNAGSEVKGTMGILNADIHFNPKDPAHGTISASADPTTIDTGIPIRDTHLKRGDYFNVEKYPEVRLKSTGFRKAGRRFTGYFDLTIKGITRPVVIYFTCTPNNNFLLFKGAFDLNRLDYDLGEKSIVLGEHVKVQIAFWQNRLLTGGYRHVFGIAQPRSACAMGNTSFMYGHGRIGNVYDLQRPGTIAGNIRQVA